MLSCYGACAGLRLHCGGESRAVFVQRQGRGISPAVRALHSLLPSSEHFAGLFLQMFPNEAPPKPSLQEGFTGRRQLWKSSLRLCASSDLLSHSFRPPPLTLLPPQLLSRSSFKGKQEIHISTDVITPAITIITIAVTQETSLRHENTRMDFGLMISALSRGRLGNPGAPGMSSNCFVMEGQSDLFHLTCRH